MINLYLCDILFLIPSHLGFYRALHILFWAILVGILVYASCTEEFAPANPKTTILLPLGNHKSNVYVCVFVSMLQMSSFGS